MANRISPRPSVVSTRLAESFATSVAEATATPTSAWPGAGASFTPSPVIPTTWPASWSALTRVNLCSGSTPCLDRLAAPIAAEMVNVAGRVTGTDATSSIRANGRVFDKVVPFQTAAAMTIAIRTASRVTRYLAIETVSSCRRFGARASWTSWAVLPNLVRPAAARHSLGGRLACHDSLVRRCR
jgi:hypothetical protein